MGLWHTWSQTVRPFLRSLYCTISHFMPWGYVLCTHSWQVWLSQSGLIKRWILAENLWIYILYMYLDFKKWQLLIQRLMRMERDTLQFFCNVSGIIFPCFSQVVARRQLNDNIYIFLRTRDFELRLFLCEK